MKSHKFWTFIAIVAGVWVLLERHEFITDDPIDTAIALGIAIAFLSASLGMALVRDDWTARSLGIFGAFLGAGLLYLAIAGVIDRWRFPMSDDKVNLIRSLLIVSGVLFNVSICRWAFAYRWQGQATAVDVTPRRRASDWGRDD